MGIFSQDVSRIQGKTSIVEDVSLESLVEDSEIDVSTISEDYEYEGNETIATVYENYNSIMTNIGITEANYVEQTGEDMVYTEGVFSNFVSVIKKFLKKIWEKIKGLFKRFLLMIDKYTMEDKAFVKKYRKELFNGKNLSDFTFKGYVYTIKDAGIQSAIDKCKTDTADFRSKAGEGREEFEGDNQDKINDKYDKIMEANRGELLKSLGGKSGSYTHEEFVKELKEVWRNGESEKEELDKISITDITNELMTAKDTKKTINNMFKQAKRVIDADEKEIERNQKNMYSEMPYDSDTSVKTDRADKDAYDRAKSGYDRLSGGGVKSIGGVQYTYDALNDIYKRMSKDCEREITAHEDEFINGKRLGDLNKIGERGWDDGGDDFKRIEGKKGDSNRWNDWDRFVWFINRFQQQRADRLNLKHPDQKDFNQTRKQWANRASKEYNLFLKLTRETKANMMAIQTSCMAALKERSRQNKAICVKYIHYNPKSESYNESYSNDDYDYNASTSGVSFLSSVELK